MLRFGLTTILTAPQFVCLSLIILCSALSGLGSVRFGPKILWDRFPVDVDQHSSLDRGRGKGEETHMGYMLVILVTGFWTRWAIGPIAVLLGEHDVL